MSIRASDFLFFQSSEWEETLEILNNEFFSDSELVSRLISFAAEFGLSGNLWQQWLTYTLMTQENAFTLTCERQKITAGSTLLGLAEADFESFRDLFAVDFAALDRSRLAQLTAYKAPYRGYEPTDAGKRIAALSEKLARAKDLKAFIRLLTGYSADYGTGIYSLYKAFRVAEDSG